VTLNFDLFRINHKYIELEELNLSLVEFNKQNTISTPKKYALGFSRFIGTVNFEMYQYFRSDIFTVF